jgi:hypothetical protein
MIAFYRAYSGDSVILPQAVAKLAEGNKVQQLIAQLNPIEAKP